MNNSRLNELIGASIASGTALTAEALTSVLTDEELLLALNKKSHALGVEAVKSSLDLNSDSDEQDLDATITTSAAESVDHSGQPKAEGDRYKHLSDSDLLENLSHVRTSISVLEYEFDRDYELGQAHDQELRLLLEANIRGIIFN